MAKKWTEQEGELLLKIHTLYTTNELAEMFETTVGSINTKKKSLGIADFQLREKTPEGMRRCKECNELLPLEAFQLRNKSNPRCSRHHYCKECTSIKKAIKHREKQLQKKEIQ